jgi:hypothetical protein
LIEKNDKFAEIIIKIIMKTKLVSLLVLAIGLFAASCEKNWTCECITTNNGNQIGSGTTTIESMKRSDAKVECDKGDGSLGSYTTDCSLK